MRTDNMLSDEDISEGLELADEYMKLALSIYSDIVFHNNKERMLKICADHARQGILVKGRIYFTFKDEDSM